MASKKLSSKELSLKKLPAKKLPLKKLSGRKLSGSKQSRGFTLLEVLIALGVLGIALGAITQSVGSTINNVSYLRDKTFAHWVGMNRIAELRSNGKWPSVGSSDGSEVMGNHEWYWKEKVSPLSEEFKDLRRVELEVRSERNDKKALVSLMVVIGKR